MIVIRELAEIVNFYDLDAEVLAASIRHPRHVTRPALAGAHIATLPFKVLQQMVHHPLTDLGIVRFKERLGGRPGRDGQGLGTDAHPGRPLRARARSRPTTRYWQWQIGARRRGRATRTPEKSEPVAIPRDPGRLVHQIEVRRFVAPLRVARAPERGRNRTLTSDR